ncbi:hypothetical protein [Streptomyces colonosanans]|nr:hypothetical protein [Streptomyces colonosanans]
MEQEPQDSFVHEQRRVPAVGCGARGMGCFLRLAGMLASLGGAGHLRAPSVYGTSTPHTWLIGILMIAAGLMAVFMGARLSRYGRRHTARVIKDPVELPDRAFTLFLRPFEDDKFLYGVKSASTRSLRRRLETPVSRTREEVLVWTFRRRFGRIVAVGQPGERLPLPGAHRFYLPLNNWKPVVSDLVKRARLVILVAGTGPGTLWELTEVVRLLPPERLLVLVLSDEAGYERFREAVPKSFENRAKELRDSGDLPVTAPPFPEYPALRDPDTPTKWIGLQGLIHFSSSWQPTFTRADPTAVWALTLQGRVRKVHRRQILPVLKRTAENTASTTPDGS